MVVSYEGVLWRYNIGRGDIPIESGGSRIAERCGLARRPLSDPAGCRSIRCRRRMS